MQLTQEVNPLIKSSNIQDKKFSIQASSKAFTILSSSLYSDKYTAIVRELSTNASDAQRTQPRHISKQGPQTRLLYATS